MTFLQAYYTSCTSGLRGSMGFQFNAASPGIDPRVFDQLERLGLYSPPRSAPIQPTAEELERFPVMLTYQRLDDGQMVFAQSKYVGLDYSGRWGNYFTHFLVAPPANGDADFLPIELWRAPVWTTRESSTKELPALQDFDLSGSINPEDVQLFLQKRAAYVAPMVEATRSALRTGRRVLIIDDAESIAFWIAAVTYALPRHLAMATSFTTYAKSPYESGATIIGTTPDSDFRGTDFEIDHQYAVFDFQGGRFSRIDASSRFARGVAAAYAESAVRVAEFPAFARRIDPDVAVDDLDPTWFGYELATGAPATDDVTTGDVRWFAKRLARFTEDQLRVFLGSAIAAAGTPGIVDALFELYESSRHVASAADAVEKLTFPLLARAALQTPEQYSPRIVANSPYSAQAIQLAAKHAAEWFAAIEASPSAAREASLLASGEVLGFGRVDPRRLGVALAKWITDPAVQERSLRMADAGAGNELLVAVLNSLRETNRAAVIEPLASWLSDDRVRAATRDVLVTTADVAFYTRILSVLYRDRVHVFSTAISGAQQLDGTLTAARVDEVADIAWAAVPLSIEEAIRVCEACQSVLPSTALVQRLPALLLRDSVDPVVAKRLIEILEAEKVKRALGDRRRFIDVFHVLQDLTTHGEDTRKILGRAFDLLSRAHLPSDVATQLVHATVLSLVSFRNAPEHSRLLLNAAKNREFLDVYERRAIERLRADPAFAIPSAALLFVAWNMCDDLGLLDRLLLPEAQRWSQKRLQAVADRIKADYPRSHDAWQLWWEQIRSNTMGGWLRRKFFGSPRKPPGGER